MHYRLGSKKSNLVDRLVEGIRCGLYPLGSRLPSERLLAGQYDASRSLVREALQDLLGRGVLIRDGRQLGVHGQALRLIERSPQQASLKVVLVVSPFQVDNPIIQRMVTVIAEHLPADIRLSTLCADRHLGAALGQLGGEDMALVVGPHFDDLVLEEIKRCCGALLLLNSPNPRFNYITPDHYAGGRMMAEHLWENHHTNIGAIYPGGCERNEMGQRFDGARDFLESQGVAIKTAQADLRVNAEPAAIYQQAFEYLHRMDGSLTALLCVYDVIALSLYELLAAKGMDIPGDISLIGFDDQYFSGMLNPPLTTVRYPAEALGVEAAGAIRQFQKQGQVAIQKMVSPALIQRESVKELSSK